MASEDVHCVSGFCRGFDWRPTVFHEPVPSFRICSLCGVIPKTVVQFGCTHSLCDPCYARCLDDESICLVDKTPLERDHAKRLSLSTEQLDEFKVSTWRSHDMASFWHTE
ncbi:secreted protein, putative [Ixodes scapularis]|uniref:Secreted protein, putative n=1 Tax=Ixodes scapularis TaxID=6945 RepID=B7PTV3_IXOSC|nr:secreted protein, putative [Ixodes scapularis]|eukprot:XP_002404961.1 secreted protein, putative [Ixodes scapularis]